MKTNEKPTCNILCLKWGTLYSADYVNILYHSVKRHIKRPFRFVCSTDDAAGLHEGIDIVPLPPNPAPDTMQQWPNIFAKLAIYKNGFADLKGPTLFLDVDIVIRGEMDCFFDYNPGKYCIIHNWIEPHKTLFRARPAIGNSSIFRFEAGEASDHIFQCFLNEIDQALDRECYPTEQAFMTHAMKSPLWWPEEWVASFKRSCCLYFPLNLILTPKNTKANILVFHGNPNPDQAIAGFKSRKIHRSTLPAPWILEDWHC